MERTKRNLLVGTSEASFPVAAKITLLLKCCSGVLGHRIFGDTPSQDAPVLPGAPGAGWPLVPLVSAAKQDRGRGPSGAPVLPQEAFNVVRHIRCSFLFLFFTREGGSAAATDGI